MHCAWSVKIPWQVSELIPHKPLWTQKRETVWQVKKKWELGGKLRLCSGPSSRGRIFIFLKLIFFKLLFCTLICSFCPFSAPHAPDSVINFLSQVQQFIGLSLQSRNWSHTYPDKTVLMSLKPGAAVLDELILQPLAPSQLRKIIWNGPKVLPPAAQPPTNVPPRCWMAWHHQNIFRIIFSPLF